MFPFHNPAQQVFNWHCEINQIPLSHQAKAAQGMRNSVGRIRKLYKQPIGCKLPYDENEFRSAYLLAYFPYYIEPVCRVLQNADLPDNLFTKNTLKAAFLGGGPCPEALGLAAYLRKRAPRLKKIEATVFDRQTAWQSAREGLVTAMKSAYKSGHTDLGLNNKPCDVVECLSRKCTCGIADQEIIIAQNFLAEVYLDRQRAIDTFERLIRRSTCRYLVFVDNNYTEVKNLMNEISTHLFSRGLTNGQPRAETSETRANFRLPKVLLQNLFTGEDGLIPRFNVKYHHLILELRR